MSKNSDRTKTIAPPDDAFSADDHAAPTMPMTPGTPIPASVPKTGKPLGEFSEDSNRAIAREKVTRRLTLNIHIFAYLLVNVLLFIIDYLTGNQGWYLWSVTGWGLALAIHIFSYLIYAQGAVSSPGSGILSYHIFIYIVVNAFLVFVNWYSNRLVNAWVLWPIIFWGLGLLVHILMYMYLAPKKGEKGKNWMDRQVQKELDKAKKA